MKYSVAIVGGGAAALALAAFLDETKFNVTIYEKGKALGSKFLVAGNGGFNLTHSEPISFLLERYTPTKFLENALLNFNNEDFCYWLNSIGVPTFVGSSKRIFPEKGIKPIHVLKAIKDVLDKKNVNIKTKKEFTGWSEKGNILINNMPEETNYTVFSLGGGSWKVTGSDGQWSNFFSDKGIDTLAFKPANCGYQINWDKDFISQYSGKPLKNIGLSCGNKSIKGELVITDFGIEGSAVYALTDNVQQQLESKGEATIYLDLKPDTRIDDLLNKLENPYSKTTKISALLKTELSLSTYQLAILKNYTTKEEFLNVHLLVRKIKELPLRIVGAAPLDDAISTTGGVALTELDEHFQLKKIPDTYCIGEMLDWNAPTGGYLLQACFSMGYHLAEKLNKA